MVAVGRLFVIRYCYLDLRLQVDATAGKMASRPDCDLLIVID